ncbi:calcium-binding protein [Alteromonas halophila]|uniref:EF-hand domain-containing protein n=1 Tax=Alteromonas halophila TaxID=516698 RepID=A0A918JE70_9ALTE|nr:calcium-binding protein [Alteromonas halophila]GGW74804.1 hypothetical protein GCM10007391_03620 [Alteromonas halophila]
MRFVVNKISSDMKARVLSAMMAPLTVATLAPLVVATMAYAQTDLLTRLDVDQDGKVSLKEAVRNTELLKNFGLIDENGDGMLTREELEKSEYVSGDHQKTDD